MNRAEPTCYSTNANKMEHFGTCSTTRYSPYIHPSRDSILELWRTFPNDPKFHVNTCHAEPDKASLENMLFSTLIKITRLKGNRIGVESQPLIGPPGVLGILREWLFIFRDLGSTGNYFRGAGSKLIVLGI